MKSVPGADRGPHAGSPRGVVDGFIDSQNRDGQSELPGRYRSRY